MPTAKVTKNVSAATGGGNVPCFILISIKTKAWIYSFRQHIYFAVYRNWFSSFWIYRQRNKPNPILQRLIINLLFLFD